MQKYATNKEGPDILLVHICYHCKMRWVMTKKGFRICVNKDADMISCAVTAQLISAFVFTTQSAQSLFFLNPKFQASSLFPPRPYRSVCRTRLETQKTGILAPGDQAAQIANINCYTGLLTSNSDSNSTPKTNPTAY